MPLNITGAKYPAQTIVSAGTTAITIGSGTFVAGDFGATQRMVALFSSADIFKGIAWVRRFVSATQIELENQFVDPVTGLYVAQAVGDKVLVSKNSAESAGAGFAVSGVPQQVAVTDLITFGTAGSQTAVCFYEENTDFHTTNCLQVLGGVAVFGKLISYDGTGRGSFIWSRECNVKPRSDYSGGGAGSVAYNVFATGGTSAHMFFFGGMVGGSFRATNFIGAFSSNATNGTFAFFGTRLFYAVVSPGTGGNWASSPERHLLYKTIHESNYQNASLITWGNGAFRGQYLAFPQFDAAIPLGMFRASTVAYFGADAGERTIISDIGRGNLIDGLNGGDYRFTNLITPAVTRVRGSGSISIEMSFSDEYTNLKPGSTVVVQRAADGFLADSVVNTSSAKFSASVVQSTYAGTASPVPQTSNHTSFGFGVKCYGFSAVSGTHEVVDYVLGTGGTGKNLTIGGLVNQLADAGTTLGEAAALALASKITINIGAKTITVSGSTTYEELYDYSVAWGCSSASNAAVPALGRYLFEWSGTSLAAPTGWSLIVSTGATLVSGEKFTRLYVPSISIEATGRIIGIYETTAGVSTAIEVRGIKPGAAYVIADNATKATVSYGTNSTGFTQSFTEYFPPGSSGTQVYVAHQLYGDQFDYAVLELTEGLQVHQFSDVPDEGITQPTLATVQAYTTLENTSKLYDYVAYFRTTEAGIKRGDIVTRAGPLLNFGGYSAVVNQSAGSVFSISGDTITIKANGLAGTSRYTTIIATPPATWTAATNEVMSVEIEDANGDSSVTIEASGVSTFEIWKISDATDPDNYTGGVLLDTVGVGKYRFVGDEGYKMVIRDTTTNFRVVSEMEKGHYSAALFFGAAVQLAQAPTVDLTYTLLQTLDLDIEKIIQNQQVINGGVKKASLIIPHSGDTQT
jgi:hypothetical protein